MSKSPLALIARKQLSKRVRQLVYGYDDYTCVYCGAKENLSLDHVIPLMECMNRWWIAVINNPINLVTACQSCNSARVLRPARMMVQGRFVTCPTLLEVYVKRTEVALDSLYTRHLQTRPEQVRKWVKTVDRKVSKGRA